jgi:hypothetical protein
MHGPVSLANLILHLTPELTESDWFPTQDTIVNGFKPSAQAVMLVDVAGGKVCCTK